MTDPHCLFPFRSITQLATKSRNKPGIWQPVIYLENTQHITYGAQPQLEAKGVRLKRKDKVPKHTGLLGSIYAMRRDVYDQLGGYPWLPGNWGKFETLLTLKAYRLGVPIYIDTETLCLHLVYRQKGEWPFDVVKANVAVNNCWTHAAIFPESYSDIWEPILQRYHKTKDVKLSYTRSSLSHPRFLEQSAYIRQHSTIDEWDLYWHLFDLGHPSRHPYIRTALDQLAATQ
jgi:hypothetical protein